MRRRKEEASVGGGGGGNDESGPADRPACHRGRSNVGGSQADSPRRTSAHRIRPASRCRVQTDVVPTSDDADSEDVSGVPAASTVVHRVRKSDSNLLGLSLAFDDHDYKSNAALSTSRQAVML